MAATYLDTHHRALLKVAEKGDAVTFKSAADGTYNPATDFTTWSPTSQVTGRAVQVRGNPLVYAALSLIETDAPTLFFVPDTYGQMPPLTAFVSWCGEVFAIRSINPIAPDGTAIAARIIVSR